MGLASEPCRVTDPRLVPPNAESPVREGWRVQVWGQGLSSLVPCLVVSLSPSTPPRSPRRPTARADEVARVPGVPLGWVLVPRVAWVSPVAWVAGERQVPLQVVASGKWGAQAAFCTRRPLKWPGRFPFLGARHIAPWDADGWVSGARPRSSERWRWLGSGSGGTSGRGEQKESGGVSCVGHRERNVSMRMRQLHSLIRPFLVFGSSRLALEDRPWAGFRCGAGRRAGKIREDARTGGHDHLQGGAAFSHDGRAKNGVDFGLSIPPGGAGASRIGPNARRIGPRPVRIAAPAPTASARAPACAARPATAALRCASAASAAAGRTGPSPRAPRLLVHQEAARA